MSLNKLANKSIIHRSDSGRPNNNLQDRKTTDRHLSISWVEIQDWQMTAKSLGVEFTNVKNVRQDDRAGKIK